MKKIFSAAFLAMALVTLPIAAQNTNEGQCDKSQGKCAKTENCDSQKAKKLAKEAKKYKGMTLSEDQKQKIKELKEKTAQERKAKKEAMKAEEQEKKELSKEERQLKKQEKENARKAYLQEFRKIVGEDNYVIFLENNYVQESAMKVGQSKDRKFKKVRPDMRENKAEKMAGKLKAPRGERGQKGPKVAEKSA